MASRLREALGLEHFEIWAEVTHHNRHLRRNNWLHWAGHVVMLFVLYTQWVHPLPVVRVDQLGKPELAARPADATPAPEEAEYVSRIFAERVLEVTSGEVARDVGRAMRMMTAGFARAYAEKVKNDQTLAALERGNIRAVVTWDFKGGEIKAETGEAGRPVRYFVQQRGRLDVYRKDVLTAPLLSKDFATRTTLLVVPRTKATLSGLLVDYFEKSYIESQAVPPVSVNPLSSSPAAPATGASR